METEFLFKYHIIVGTEIVFYIFFFLRDARFQDESIMTLLQLKISYSLQLALKLTILSLSLSLLFALELPLYVNNISISYMTRVYLHTSISFPEYRILDETNCTGVYDDASTSNKINP